jgi:hypothetical protein
VLPHIQLLKSKPGFPRPPERHFKGFEHTTLFVRRQELLSDNGLSLPGNLQTLAGSSQRITVLGDSVFRVAL